MLQALSKLHTHPIPSVVSNKIFNNAICSSEQSLTSNLGLPIEVNVIPKTRTLVLSVELPRMVRTIKQQYTTTKHAILIPELKLTLHSKLRLTKTGFSKLVKPYYLGTSIIDPAFLSQIGKTKTTNTPSARKIYWNTLARLFSQTVVCLGYYPEIRKLFKLKPITQITDTFGQIIVEFFSSGFLPGAPNSFLKLSSYTEQYIKTEDEAKRDELMLKMFMVT